MHIYMEREKGTIESMKYSEFCGMYLSECINECAQLKTVLLEYIDLHMCVKIVL